MMATYILSDKLFRLLNTSDLNADKLKNFFIQFEQNEQIVMIQSYFMAFHSKVYKMFDISKTLEPMKQVSEELKLYELINNTPGLAYKVLSSCDTLPYLKWAVEEMKINPLCISQSTNVYSKFENPYINTNYMSGEHISIFSVNTDEKNHYMFTQLPTCNPQHLTTIKQEIIYQYIGKKDKAELVEYLLNLGCGKEVLNKKISSKDKVKNVLLTAFDSLFEFAFIILLAVYLLAHQIDVKSAIIIFLSAICLSLLHAVYKTHTVILKYRDIKNYLTNIKI